MWWQLTVCAVTVLVGCKEEQLFSLCHFSPTVLFWDLLEEDCQTEVTDPGLPRKRMLIKWDECCPNK